MKYEFKEGGSLLPGLYDEHGKLCALWPPGFAVSQDRIQFVSEIIDAREDDEPLTTEELRNAFRELLRDVQAIHQRVTAVETSVSSVEVTHSTCLISISEDADGDLQISVRSLGNNVCIGIVDSPNLSSYVLLAGDKRRIANKFS